MSNTTFIDNSTVIYASWLNDINNVTYNLLGNGTTVPTTKPGLLTNIGALASANNLSDIGNAATARTNLGLGTAATQPSTAFATSGANSNITSLTGLTTALTTSQGGTGTLGTLTGILYGNGSSAQTVATTAQVINTLGTLTANNVLLGNGTSALQTVAPGTSGNVLTSNGTTWQSTAPVGSLILLDTKATTSGTSVTSSTLNLTSYKQVLIIFNAVSTGSATNSKLYISSSSTGQVAAGLGSASDNNYGSVTIDLATGIYWANIAIVGTGAAPVSAASSPYAGATTYSTSSTTITVYTAGATFDNGSVQFYGIK